VECAAGEGHHTAGVLGWQVVLRAELVGERRPAAEVVGMHVGVDDMGHPHVVRGRQIEVGLGVPGRIDDHAGVAGHAHDV
jgi:hypothetical protein